MNSILKLRRCGSPYHFIASGCGVCEHSVRREAALDRKSRRAWDISPASARSCGAPRAIPETRCKTRPRGKGYPGELAGKFRERQAPRTSSLRTESESGAISSARASAAFREIGWAGYPMECGPITYGLAGRRPPMPLPSPPRSASDVHGRSGRHPRPIRRIP